MDWFTRTIRTLIDVVTLTGNEGGRVNKEFDRATPFQALVERSIIAWDSLNYVGNDHEEAFPRLTRALRNISSLEALLESRELFWFFQRRESFLQQTTLQKWSPDSLDAYILLPLHYGFANNEDCFFISHYWHTATHPDPSGADMRLFLEDLGQIQWSYVWVDWTCMPQSPRSEAEKSYFKKMLRFIPALVRDCGFEWRFPAFAPRAWILFEVAEYILNHSRHTTTDDIAPFISHVKEMVTNGVRPVISKYGYACSNGSDISLVVGWLEVLVILVKVTPDISLRKEIFDWLNKDEVGTYVLLPIGLEIDKVNGIITEYDGTQHKFTPVFDPHQIAL